MNVRALSSSAVSIVLAASLFTGSAGAGTILCGDVSGHASKELGCDYLKDKKPPHDFDFKDSKDLKVKHSVAGSKGWDGSFVLDGKWPQPSLHDAQPKVGVPEPSALALLGLGLVGMALSRRCRRK